MEKIYMSEYLNNIQRYLANKNQTVMVYNDRNCVLEGADTLNRQFCDSKGLIIYKTHGFGGTIVNFKDDICIGNYQPNFNNFGSDFIERLAKWLNTKGLNAIVDNNDVLIDGKYKVASYMSQYVNGCLYTAIHISVNMDLGLINSICTKTMNKIPKGLIEYGITSAEINQTILSWLE